MKILVCISQSPDTTTKISFTDNNTKLNEEGVNFIINPNDDFALSRAIDFRDANGGSVTVINIGPVSNEQIIRKALAIGADDAIRVDAVPLDAFYIASQIAHIAKQEQFDIILTGRETIDHNGSQVNSMIAEMMGVPCVTGVSSLDISGNEATIVREIEGGKETVSTSLPMVIGAMEGMAEARIPNMRGIMSARSKPLKVVPPIEAPMLTKVRNFEPLPPKGDCKYIDAENPEQLVELLHSEAKVI